MQPWRQSDHPSAVKPCDLQGMNHCWSVWLNQVEVWQLAIGDNATIRENQRPLDGQLGTQNHLAGISNKHYATVAIFAEWHPHCSIVCVPSPRPFSRLCHSGVPWIAPEKCLCKPWNVIESCKLVQWKPHNTFSYIENLWASMFFFLEMTTYSKHCCEYLAGRMPLIWQLGHRSMQGFLRRPMQLQLSSWMGRS